MAVSDLHDLCQRSASRERTLDSPRCVARSHQTYSTVSTSLCIQIIKAAWWRGVVMLCDVAWELRNGRLRSTTATTGQPPPATAAEQEVLEDSGPLHLPDYPTS